MLIVLIFILSVRFFSSIDLMCLSCVWWSRCESWRLSWWSEFFVRVVFVVMSFVCILLSLCVSDVVISVSLWRSSGRSVFCLVCVVVVVLVVVGEFELR